MLFFSWSVGDIEDSLNKIMTQYYSGLFFGKKRTRLSSVKQPRMGLARHDNDRSSTIALRNADYASYV